MYAGIFFYLLAQEEDVLRDCCWLSNLQCNATYHNGKLALENLVSHANQYSDVHKAYDMMQRQDPRS